jgi:hypothetical protein
MPAQSKAQQKLMGMVHAAQKGELKNPTGTVADLANTMKKKSATDFASTKHKGLPNKVKKEEKEPVMENTFEFYLVMDPASFGDTNTPEDIEKMVVATNPADFVAEYSNMVRGSDMSRDSDMTMAENQIHGYYSTQEEAMKVANTLLTDKMASQKSLEEKKSQVVDKIDKVIAKLQKEINDHMKMTTEAPEEADKYHSMAETKMSKIKELREKHKAVAASKKQLQEKE